MRGSLFGFRSSLFEERQVLAMWVCLGLLIVGSNARADREILFMDFNMASDEVIRVEKFAESESKAGRPTHVVRIPNMSRTDDIARKNLFRNLDKVSLEMKTKKCSTTTPCLDLDAKMSDIYKGLSQISDRYRMTSPQIHAAVSEACKNRKFERVDLSGHDGTGDFYGEIGNMQIEELGQLVKENPTCLGPSVRGLYLFGCYTATPGKASCLWPTIFPSAEFVVGYDSMSPRSDRANNLTILSKMMEMQESLVAQKDATALKSTLDKISDLSSARASIYFPKCDRYYRGKKLMTVAEARAISCREAAPKIQKIQEVFDCHFHAKAGCENPPENTGSSPLRDAYNFLQQSERCFSGAASREKCKQMGVGESPDANRTVRMIFYRNILANFQLNQSQVLASYQNALDQLGLTEDGASPLKVPQLKLQGQASRKQILDWAKTVREFVSKRAPSEGLENFKKQFSTIEAKLVRFECVPFGWVEPDAKLEPKC